MGFGSTTGKEPDPIMDEDLKSPDELRGAMKQIASAKKSIGELATIQGMQTEIQVLKQQLEMTHEQMRSLINLYQTLRDQFDQYQAQRLLELNVKVNGGSTTPEDME